MDSVSEIRDLGVLFDAKLTFKSHINNVTNRAFKLCGFIRRQSSEFINNTAMTILYKTLIVSILNYASPIWNPSYSTYIERLERVQKKIVKFQLFKLRIDYKTIPYNTRFQILGYENLEKLRTNSDAVLAFKILRNIYNTPDILSMFNFRVPAFPFRNNELLILNMYRNVYGQQSLFNRMQIQLNKLHDGVDNLFNISLKNVKKITCYLTHRIVTLLSLTF